MRICWFIFPETLTVQQNYFQARYGQITLGAGGRIAQMNNISLGGGSLYDYTRMIILDDASIVTKTPIRSPYYGEVDGFLRAGDTSPVASLTLVVSPVSLTRVRLTAPHPAVHVPVITITA